MNIPKRIFILSLFLVAFLVHAQDWKSERTVRYRPDGGDFVIQNGKNKFNRSLYGTNTEFRIEAGDVPEFALYLPGMGGNLKFALQKGDRSIWLSEAASIETRYRPGSLIYTVSDPIIGEKPMVLTVLARSDVEGLIVQVKVRESKDVRLIAVYGGASNEVFRRAGERNVDAAGCFDLKEKNCIGNIYELNLNHFKLTFGQKTIIPAGAHLVDEVPRNGRSLEGTFPENASLRLVEAASVQKPLSLMKGTEQPKAPVLVVEVPLASNQVHYFSIQQPQGNTILKSSQLPFVFAQSEKARASLASRLTIHTPDPYLNAVGGALSVAADAIWQDPSYLHGAISWRVRIPGWRAAYVATALGWNDRAKTHFTAYANSQLTAPDKGPVEMDTATSFGRVTRRIGNAMFSSGYICPLPNNPKLADLCFYDMNLVYIDELLRHVNNTGDLTFARKLWPTIQRHLAWEKRTFDADGDGLYDAFACIWASDALQYNGGGVTHSSAYTCFANKCAAELAVRLDYDPSPYRQESEKILKAINSKLWLSDKGQYAEFVDAMGQKKTHESAGLWTVYHAIDSEIADGFQRYQALRYVDTQIPHIPFKVKGLENERFETVATTNWMPYYWSINNVTPAEQLHTALAYWQGGRSEEAFNLLKSTVMDVMYCGSSPGNFPMMSIYNAAGHSESYRDFADVIGIASRTLVEGLIGLNPDAVHGCMVVRPGLPASWDFASFRLPYLTFDFKQTEGRSRYALTQNRTDLLAMKLQIPAKSDRIKQVKVNGKTVNFKWMDEAVGAPMLEIDLPAVQTNEVVVTWSGKPVVCKPIELEVANKEENIVSLPAQIVAINDPQGILATSSFVDSTLKIKVEGNTGARTIFAKVKQGDLKWWQPVHVRLNPPVELIAGDLEDSLHLNVFVRNNTNKALSGTLKLGRNNGHPFVKNIQVPAHGVSELVEVPTEFAVLGTNKVEFETIMGEVYSENCTNWTLPLKSEAQFEQVNLSAAFNDKVSNIFAKNKYLSPRSPYTTLQLPLQGMGDWCVPLRIVEVNDSGFRASAKNNRFEMPFGLSFSTPMAADKPNIAFVSLFDNYPDSLLVPLNGKAMHAYLLMAGSTNHMQSRMENGRITVKYRDGSVSVLKLINPGTWAPIERDYFTDAFSYKMDAPRPYRVVLKTGQVARNLDQVIKGDALDARLIDGGGAILLDVPLEVGKELVSLTLSAEANEVVIGLMGVTLVR